MLKIEEESGITPKALERQPEIDDEILKVVEVFFLLFRGESLPVSDLINYSSLIGVDDVERFIILLKEAERIVMQAQQDKIKKR